MELFTSNNEKNQILDIANKRNVTQISAPTVTAVAVTQYASYQASLLGLRLCRLSLLSSVSVQQPNRGSKKENVHLEEAPEEVGV